jgi:predicted acyl esterase
LPRDVVATGPGQVHLRAALSATEGNLVVKLEDVAPDGGSQQASVGFLKASHYRSHEQTAPITPGKMIDFAIPLWPAHWRCQAGHRIRIAVTSGDVPMHKSYRWCVRRSTGEVVAVFSGRSRGGRARLIATTARGHRMRGLGRGSSVRLLRRAPGKLRGTPRAQALPGLGRSLRLLSKR